jgi:radical SAM superfamily enzyme YgiQ (UPF0313 family)
MRILLISPNIEMLPDPVFPLGLAYLSAALNGSSHEHSVLDLCFVDDYEEAIKLAVDELKPQAIGLSLRNVDNVAYPNAFSYLPFYESVISHLRRITSAPIVLGGSGFSLMPVAILSHLRADYGIVGEGEVSLVLLLDHLEKGLPTDGLPGTVSSSSPEKLSPPLPRPSLEDLPAPCREKLANGKYLRFGGMGNIQTKRGCSFSCVYCTYPIIEGRDVRLRPASHVAEEIRHLCQQDIDTLFMVDSVFNFPPHHAKSVCLEILERGLKVRWSCYLHPQFVTESLLRLMKEAGCSSVEFGTDSASDRLLKRLGKSFTKADIRRASELCHKVGIPFCHSLIFGIPGESRESIQEAFDLMAEVSPTAVIAMSGIRLFPGTRLAETAAREDLILPDDSMLQPTFHLSKSSRPFLFEMLYSHTQSNPHWILPGSNVNMDKRLQEKLRRFGIKGPLWEHMKIRKR